MNKIILIFVLFFNILNAQEDLVKNGNLLNPSLDKFVGTWVGTTANGLEKITIILKKDNVLAPMPDYNFRFDILIGFHKYEKRSSTTSNFQVIENSLDYSNTKHTDKKSTLFIGNNPKDANLNIIDGSIKNITNYNWTGSLRLLINSTKNQLTWTLTNSEGVRIITKDKGPYNLNLPRNLVLTKQ